MTISPEDDMARLHDGWAYAVFLSNGTKIRFCDHDSLSAVMARLEALADSTGKKLIFSGAAASFDATDDEGNPTGAKILKGEGEGFVAADLVAGIRHWSDQDDNLKDEAYEAALAVLEAQGAATVEMMRRSQEVEQGEDQVPSNGTTTENDESFKMLPGPRKG